jgi:ATP-dependent Lon protease
MEVITLTGYTEDEKVQIAGRHIVGKQLQEHGLAESDLEFNPQTLRTIIRGYTREAGLRNLEREIAAVCRKIAMRFAMGRRQPVVLDAAKIRNYLGPARNIPGERLLRDQVGVATGLAWTPYGGEVLFVEAQAMNGKGSLILTGQMGDVMRESAHAALSYIKAHSKEYEIPDELFASRDFHIHIPEGAIPKDGPSAGITLASALVSACTGRPVHKSIAMTGEITLRGNILPVGGVKEKILAAHRGQVHTVMIPRPNRKDLQDIPRQLKQEMKVILIDTVADVLKRALVWD